MVIINCVAIAGYFRLSTNIRINITLSKSCAALTVINFGNSVRTLDEDFQTKALCIAYELNMLITYEISTEPVFEIGGTKNIWIITKMIQAIKVFQIPTKTYFISLLLIVLAWILVIAAANWIHKLESDQFDLEMTLHFDPLVKVKALSR
jgi:hypothetical protein